MDHYAALKIKIHTLKWKDLQEIGKEKKQVAKQEIGKYILKV